MRMLVFLIINFGALALGGWFTGSGVTSEWYAQLNKAPWTPPGWVFGAAWTSIMILFSFYMSYAWDNVEDKKLLLGLFSLQWVLNVAWNPIFFYFNQSGFALVVIILLTILIGFLLLFYWTKIKYLSLLLLPYFLWMIIATSLNAYIYFKN